MILRVGGLQLWCGQPNAKKAEVALLDLLRLGGIGKSLSGALLRVIDALLVLFIIHKHTYK